MQKDAAIRTIVECARKYANNLVGYNHTFVFGDVGSVGCVETLYLPQNFLHLTGLVIADQSLSSANFLSMCLDGRLTSSSFDFSKDGTTILKLSVLPQLMELHKTAKMIGDYSENRIKLNTEKIIGHVSACMGFVRSKESPDYFVPNTVLKEDIRDVVQRPVKRILAVFKKSSDEYSYSICTYLAKGIALDSIELPENYKRKVSVQESRNDHIAMSNHGEYAGKRV